MSCLIPAPGGLVGVTWGLDEFKSRTKLHIDPAGAFTQL